MAQFHTAIDTKEHISSTLQRWVTYVQAWKALSEEGKEHLQVVAQYLLYLRAGAVESLFESHGRNNCHEHVSVVSQHWEKVKELISKLEKVKHGMHRCLSTLETLCNDSVDTVLFCTLSVSQLMKYMGPVTAAFSKDFTCKQQIVSSFWNYTSRDILLILITIWWRQPLIDPIEVDFVVGAIVAELAIDEYNILGKDSERNFLYSSLPTNTSNSEIFSYLLS
ncbi:hypothetical protein GpartN1_g4048.t1 [Galdieria partita]|uniref:Uncharacterized protein n=1 Tax=Galdieria partita TaxID=83374 RepID=A0A9C7PYK3_9RHOD|nr:hypothetical protein GpartN1_g4048.t1 [Galdieria partita]